MTISVSQRRNCLHKATLVAALLLAAAQATAAPRERTNEVRMLDTPVAPTPISAPQDAYSPAPGPATPAAASAANPNPALRSISPSATAAVPPPDATPAAGRRGSRRGQRPDTAPAGATTSATLAAADEPEEPAAPIVPETVPPHAPSSPLASAIGSYNPGGPAPHETSGVFTGRIVYCSGGHGFTYNLEKKIWYTQRGETLNGTCEVVEDLGNVDQLTSFADSALNAGAMVVPFRPIGFQNNEVVIDNENPNVTYVPETAWVGGAGARYFGTAGDKVRYRVAAAATAATPATAAAVFDASKLIPAAGNYPVYVWAPAGRDRINQEFVVTHGGGQTLRRINLRMTGGFWIYLGTYFFKPGGPAAVTVTNAREAGDPGSVVVADAVRFGNGMGDVDRGTGKSGRSRQDECSKYWVMAGIGQGATPRQSYGNGGNDQSDNVGTPPRTAALMNATAADWPHAGTREQRIFIGFHSNASSGKSRGAVGLYCSNIDSPKTPNASCTKYQVEYAKLIGRITNEDLYAFTTAPGNPFEIQWGPRGKAGSNPASFIFGSGGALHNTYGEINTGPTKDEFDATINEVAYHDEPSDCKLMRDPRIRLAISRATLRAIGEYFTRFGGGVSAMPPEPPRDPMVVSDASGSLLLHWSTPPAGTPLGDPATAFLIEVSADGRGYGTPKRIEGGTTMSADVSELVPPGEARYFRVVAVNAAGESFPSPSVGARRAESRARTLVVNGYTREGPELNPRQTLALAGDKNVQTIDRIDPQRSNSFNYVPIVGESLRAAGMEFDSCQRAAVESGAVDLSAYRNVFWIAGRNSTRDRTLSPKSQEAVARFLDAGGNFFISGTDVALDLESRGGPAEKAFATQRLGISLASDDAATRALKGGQLLGNAGAAFDDGTQGQYDATAPDALKPASAESRVVIDYQGGSGGAAAVARAASATQKGRAITLGFPFETVTTATARDTIIKNSLAFFEGPAAQ